MDFNKYDETISTSKQESLMKAIAIFKEQEALNKETVSRPNIDIKKTIIQIVAFLFFFLFGLSITFVVFRYTKSILLLLLCLLLLFAFVSATLKRFIVLLILLYQQTAPEDLRLSCVFQPSCSEYMLLAIEKYGVVKGVFVGVKRLLRCHPPNGGTDNP